MELAINQGDCYDRGSTMVPQRVQAYAMGATNFEVITRCHNAICKRWYIGSIILALGRALGETMAVAFLIGSVITVPERITDPKNQFLSYLRIILQRLKGWRPAVLYYLGLILFIGSYNNL